MKPPLLYLCHRIPYPPNKGDKIRSFNVLQYLARRYRIYLGAFVDDRDDWQYADRLKAWCEECYFEHLNPAWARVRSLQGFLTGEPLTLPYYREAGMRNWVRRIKTQARIEQVLIYSSSMAQYAFGEAFSGANRVIDFVDVDSDKWRQYSEKKRWPMNRVYRREAERLLAYERETADRFSRSLFVSEAEAALFRQFAPESADRISFFSNGVDLTAFDPDREYPDPFPDANRRIVFTGAMDYWPNEDAVSWFVQEVLPGLRQRWPDTVFYIVGSRPTDSVVELGRQPGVTVTGKVAEVQPYIQHATAVVAPMRIARGIQNKVLEAMSMARPVVVTAMGLEGIGAADGEEVLVANSGSNYIDRLSSLFSGEYADIGTKARQKVHREFGWDATLPKLAQWLQ